MYCVACGKEIENGLKFCPYCGQTQEEKKEANASYENVTTERAENASAPVNAPETVVMASDSDVFVDADEQKIDALGNGWVKNLVLSHGIKNNSLMLSNKRLYFQGKSLKKGKIVKCEQVVNVEDVSGGTIESISPFKSLIIWGAILVYVFADYLRAFGHQEWIDYHYTFFNEIILGELFGFNGNGDVGSMKVTYTWVIIILISIIVLTFFLKRKSYLKIDYSGGEILFELNASNKHKASGFMKKLNKIKDKRRAELGSK
ncbi:zinc ribbon domain-containing protein [Pseudobutyrivibrio sp.]|uniref:zinc ribbon domain-containing protein n=1 Tax=Pseudobutyrivibrio sp. TaxID=2014367 RepID=UPI001E0B9BAA|nr:zinc ribbon domain-containing protein [Pseudobutyrivibrio sp.]MBE5911683.1 zinc ribbon domain-containing protein [Pseudobutyrivibrio sp.]